MQPRARWAASQRQSTLHGRSSDIISAFLNPRVTRAPTAARAALRPLYFDVVAFEGLNKVLRLGVVTSAPPEADNDADADAERAPAAPSSSSSSSPSSPSSPGPGTITVAPLRPSPCWVESGLWVEDDGGPGAGEDGGISVSLSAVRAVLAGASLEQRQDPVGLGNPHGEHAHDVWLLPARVAVADGGEEEEGQGPDAEVRRRVDALLAGVVI